jgi:hypothetical protein
MDSGMICGVPKIHAPTEDTMPTAKRVPKPNDATARYLRRYLRKADVEDLVKAIHTGKDFTVIRIQFADEYDVENEISARKVADALRPMWHDGDTRVKVQYGGAISIAREGWHLTMPNTAEGLAQLEEAEQERNEQLLNDLANGKQVRTVECFTTALYKPSPEDPRRPWIKWSGKRFTPWQVSSCRPC